MLQKCNAILEYDNTSFLINIINLFKLQYTNTSLFKLQLFMENTDHDMQLLFAIY